MPKVFKVYRLLTAKDKLNILYGTYGSLTQFREKLYGVREVARQTGCCVSTVFSALRRFDASQHDVKAFLKKQHRPGAPRKLVGSKAIERKLLDPVTLTKWAHLTIRQRAVKILKQFKVSITPERLRFFYRRSKLRYRQTALKYYPHGRNLVQLEQERMEFALMLSNAIADQRQIIYMDETTFNQEQMQSRAWYF
jgi:transposase